MAKDVLPLVLLHSIGTSGMLWGEVAAVLERTRPVLRVDFRGHGETPATPGPYSMGSLAGDVLAAMDAAGFGRAHLGGVSLGGMVAQAVAAMAPGRVASLTLVGTTMALPPPAMWHERATAVRAGGMAPMAGVAIPRWVGPDAPVAVRDALRAMLLGTDPEGYAGAAEAIAGADLTGTTPGLRVRTLILVGDGDVATPPAMSEALHAAIPGSELRVLRGAAHLPMADVPDVVAAEMAGFLGG